MITLTIAGRGNTFTSGHLSHRIHRQQPERNFTRWHWQAYKVLSWRETLRSLRALHAVTKITRSAFPNLFFRSYRLLIYACPSVLDSCGCMCCICHAAMPPMCS